MTKQNDLQDDEGYDLDDQRGDEEIVLVRHQHPWVLAKMGLIFVILIVVVVGVFLIWKSSTFSWAVLGLAVIIILIYGINATFLYKNSVFVITDQRVINVSQKNIFNRLVQEIDLDNIFNLTYEIKGPMASLLNFGNVKLTTIGDDENSIQVRHIENPYFVYNKISDMRKKALGKSGRHD